MYLHVCIYNVELTYSYVELTTAETHTHTHVIAEICQGNFRKLFFLNHNKTAGKRTQTNLLSPSKLLVITNNVRSAKTHVAKLTKTFPQTAVFLQIQNLVLKKRARVKRC